VTVALIKEYLPGTFAFVFVKVARPLLKHFLESFSSSSSVGNVTWAATALRKYSLKILRSFCEFGVWLLRTEKYFKGFDPFF